MMRRLYLQIYATVIGVLLLFVVLISTVWTFLPDGPWEQRLAGAGGFINDVVLPSTQTPAELRETISRMGEFFVARVTVRSPDGAVLAAAGEVLPPPQRGPRGNSPRVGSGDTDAVIDLPDGRTLHVSWEDRGPPALLLMLALLAVAIALGALPVARRITRRLERLQTRVDALGAGEFSSRVEIEGKDEVAELARSFNDAADRIERLVDAQRDVLAGVSHEIRTPLARMRVALELLESENRPELKERLLKDISELDELIGELLLASRLDAIEQLERTEDVDILALLAEEAARTGAEVSGDPVTIHGDPRMLRRLIRNLLENARRHAPDSPVEASVKPGASGGALLAVSDRGPGIPEQERERIFEPFYRAEDARLSSDRSVGLGLALVRRIASRHGGEARCLPREGGGTTFEVALRDV